MSKTNLTIKAIERADGSLRYKILTKYCQIGTKNSTKIDAQTDVKTEAQIQQNAKNSAEKCAQFQHIVQSTISQSAKYILG